LDRIRAEGAKLAPWYLKVEIAPGLSTEDLYDASRDRSPKAQFYDPAPALKDLLRQIYPDGLEGRSVLDCACNNGAYLFAAKEMGAGRCFGFDARELWISQARFLLEHRQGPTDGMQFEVCNLYDVPELRLEQFDITIFSGILYHLPEPVGGLKIAADLTRELVYVSTTSSSEFPDGALIARNESKVAPLCGVYGLHWLPTGPRVIMHMLASMGFPEARPVNWSPITAWIPKAAEPELGVVQVIASREIAALASFDASRPKGVERMLELVCTLVPPASTVLVASQADDAILKIPCRSAWHFPRGESGTYGEGVTGYDGPALISRLDDLRHAGAEYLVIPDSESEWFGQTPLVIS
jgi:tRNA (mo5U34)-methyltransferase